ncbi:hypothetical protein OPV22_034253 [Ensete ventricosum]|uniref:Uncharacterized protein n=1 Tax=Ensete ventricosum TaxID=4639 RepID=A0AAV8PRZ0_ENSVE|nr:hypothetical protein OPV22_034253 [Ensete ventricosum]
MASNTWITKKDNENSGNNKGIYISYFLEPPRSFHSPGRACFCLSSPLFLLPSLHWLVVPVLTAKLRGFWICSVGAA